MCEYPKTITLSRKSGQKQDFLIRRCTEADLSDIMELQQKVYEDIGNPDLYAIVPEENIHESILEDYCFGTYVNDRLIAFTMMIANRISYRNYGTYVGFPEERQAKCVRRKHCAQVQLRHWSPLRRATTTAWQTSSIQDIQSLKRSLSMKALCDIS